VHSPRSFRTGGGQKIAKWLDLVEIKEMEESRRKSKEIGGYENIQGIN